MLDILSRLPARLLLLKALQKKSILVPAYTRSDGTYVPAHYKVVNYNPDTGAVLSGKSSHSHKEALKKLSKVPGFKDLPAEHQHAHVLSSAQNIQTAASKAAQVSVFKKELLAGKKPKAANIAAFKELLKTDEKKAVAIRDSIIAAIGMDKFIDLVGWHASEQEVQTALTPTKEELSIATDKLIEIASGAPGKKVGQQAYKLLEKDPEWVKKNAVDRLQDVVDKWKELQDAATFAAKVSTLTSKLAAGKVPSPSELKAYEALDSNGKLKAAQTAIKKSGGKQSFGSLAELMKQAEAKAGITVDKPEKVSLKQVAQNFGHQHEGQVVGVPGAQAKFKFENGKWNYWTGDGWGEVKAAEWLTLLDQGQTPFKQQMEVVADPSGKTSFGEAHPGQEFDCSKYYTVKWSDGEWKFRYKKDGKPDPNAEWHSIANNEMVAALDAGKKYGDQGQAVEPLEPVGDSGPPEEDDAQWVYNDYDPAFSGCPTLIFDDHYVANDGAQYEVGTLGTDEVKHYSAPQRVQAYLQSKGVNPPTLTTLEKMQADAEAGPKESDSAWTFDAADEGFGGDPTLTMDGPDGLLHVITYSSMDDHFQVGTIDPDGDLDFDTYALASEVVAALKQKGMYPPSEKTLLEKLVGDFEGPQEGDTKQGVGGLLTLKDGHWTLNNAAMVSFFNEHAIKPGSATAIAVTMAVAYISEGKDPSTVMAQLVSVKEAAKHQGYSPAQINDIIIALNSVHSEVLDYTDPFGDPLAGKPSGVAEADAAGFEPDVNTPEEADSGYSYASYLTNTSEGHSKFWAVEVDPVAKTATTTWGKIGAKKPQSKTYKHSSAQAAYQAAKDAVTAKLGKGYVSKTVLDGGGTPLPPPPAAPSFKPTVGHVYSGTTSTGSTLFVKYNGGSGNDWSHSWDPKDGWDPVAVHSALHDALKQGKMVSGHGLLDLGADGESQAWKFEPGQVFEAGYSASSSAKMTFKYVGDGKWEHPFNDGWTPVTTAAWIEALNSGKGLDGKPITEVASSNNGFGAKNAGKVFVAKAPGGTFQVLFKYDPVGHHWQLSTNDGSSWDPVQAGTVLADQLEKGVDGSGKSLQLHTEDAYGNPQEGASEAAPAVDDGPHEGDLKWGVNGWLVLKDGHWVKASLDEALTKLCPVPEDIQSAFFKQALNGVVHGAAGWKKVATSKMGKPNVTLTINGFGKFVGRAQKTDLGKAGKWEAASPALSAKNIADALNFLEHFEAVKAAFEKNKKIPEPLVPNVAPIAPVPAPAAPATSAPASIDGWKKVGEQGGFNPGGTYVDPMGDEWYCKFPAGGAKVAHNELLANKLYEAAGLAVPEVKLVTQGGKIGLASRIVTGATQDKKALQSGQGEGLLSGFVADAWLANWDVVGNNPAAGKGWDNILFKQGVAYRIDPGGALLYGGAGGKKTKFGDQVIELETMRDASVNARTAKVFGKISDADLKASAAKVLAISDAQIEQMVKQFGPGDELEKAALAKTLKARKADIAAKFPAVAAKVAKEQAANASQADPGAAVSGAMKAEKKKPVFKPEELSAPPDFLNWSGPGKHGPATLEAKNIANQEGVNKLLEVAKKGDPELIKSILFPLYDKDGNVVGEMTALEHKSQYVRGYAQQLINEIDFQLNPPKVFRFKQDSELGGIAAAFPTIHKITASLKRLGKYVLLGESDGFPETEVASYPKQTYKNGKVTTSTFAAQSKAVWAKIPTLQQQAVSAYCGPKSGSINSALWAGNPSGQAASAMAAMHTHAYELPAGLVLSRKISLNSIVLEQMVGKDLINGKPGQIGQGGATGKVLQEPALGSTSISPDVWSGNVHLKLICGPGVKGLYAGTPTGISPHSGEKEMLLPPNTRYLVRSVRKSPPGGDPDGFGKGSQYIVEVLLLPTETA